jgi:hypothetical protein
MHIMRDNKLFQAEIAEPALVYNRMNFVKVCLTSNKRSLLSKPSAEEPLTERQEQVTAAGDKIRIGGGSSFRADS